MPQTPILHQGRSTPWQAPKRDLSGPDVHERLEPLIMHMDVRWRVIVVPHPYDDTEKHGYHWHG